MYLKTYNENVYQARWYFWSWTKAGWIFWLGHNIRLVLSFYFILIFFVLHLLPSSFSPSSFLFPFCILFILLLISCQSEKKKIVSNIWMSKILMGGYVLFFLWLMEIYTSYYCLLIHRVSLGKLVDTQIISSLLVILLISVT